MKYMMRKNLLIIIITLINFLAIQTKADSTRFPAIVLDGDNGGMADGSKWESISLKNKVNLILYVDPDKQKEIKPLAVKLDSLNYSSDSLNMTFILNTSATIIPNFIIRNRVKKKAKSSDNIIYVLDEEKILVKEWNLIDNDINVLLMDTSGKILVNHHGKMTKEFINGFINQIENLINKGESK